VQRAQANWHEQSGAATGVNQRNVSAAAAGLSFALGVPKGTSRKCAAVLPTNVDALANMRTDCGGVTTGAFERGTDGVYFESERILQAAVAGLPRVADDGRDSTALENERWRQLRVVTSKQRRFGSCERYSDLDFRSDVTIAQRRCRQGRDWSGSSGSRLR
jgi:hypothetical protein